MGSAPGTPPPPPPREDARPRRAVPLRVAYVAGARLARLSDGLPVHRDRSSVGRAELVHTLAWHRGLLACPGAGPAAAREDGAGDADQAAALEAAAFRALASRHEDSDQPLAPPAVPLPPASRARLVFPRPLAPREACAYHDPDYVQSLLEGGAGPGPRPVPAPKRRKTLCTTRAAPGPTPKRPAAQPAAMAPHALAVAGASVAAAEQLRSGSVDVAVAFDGGRHHAHKAAAAGYCYLNDVVLAIQALRRPVRKAAAAAGTARRFDRVAYIDLDLHWGDGVEEAFLSNPSVLTVSMHHAAPGFYPPAPYVVGAVPLNETNTPHALRLPLDLGTSDASVRAIWDGVEQVLAAFRADAYVVQLGADGNTADPHGIWNLGTATYDWCVQRILQLGKPAILLGGGGYDAPSTALIWTGVLASVLGAAEAQALPADLGIWSRLNNTVLGEVFTASTGTSHLSDTVRMGHSWSVQSGMKQDLNSAAHIQELLAALADAAGRIQETDGRNQADAHAKPSDLVEGSNEAGFSAHASSDESVNYYPTVAGDQDPQGTTQHRNLPPTHTCDTISNPAPPRLPVQSGLEPM